MKLARQWIEFRLPSSLKPREIEMKIVKFVGAHNSPQAGQAIHMNADAVGIIVEGPGSKHDRPVTSIHCGGFPVLVAASLEDTLVAFAL